MTVNDSESEWQNLNRAKRNHLLSVRVPYFQAQTADDVSRPERSDFCFLKFRNCLHCFGQTIERNFRIQMMNVMKADVRGNPLPEKIHLHITWGFERCMLITPFNIISESNPGKIMLSIKKIRAKSTGNWKWNQNGKHPGNPTEENNCAGNKCNVKNECNERIIMPARAGEKRKNAHAKTEKSKISENHIERMPYCKIFSAFARSCVHKFLLGKIGRASCRERV